METLLEPQQRLHQDSRRSQPVAVVMADDAHRLLDFPQAVSQWLRRFRQRLRHRRGGVHPTSSLALASVYFQSSGNTLLRL